MHWAPFKPKDSLWMLVRNELRENWPENKWKTNWEYKLLMKLWISAEYFESIPCDTTNINSMNEHTQSKDLLAGLDVIRLEAHTSEYRSTHTHTNPFSLPLSVFVCMIFAYEFAKCNLHFVMICYLNWRRIQRASELRWSFVE